MITRLNYCVKKVNNHGVVLLFALRSLNSGSVTNFCNFSSCFNVGDIMYRDSWSNSWLATFISQHHFTSFIKTLCNRHLYGCRQAHHWTRKETFLFVFIHVVSWKYSNWEKIFFLVVKGVWLIRISNETYRIYNYPA